MNTLLQHAALKGQSNDKLGSWKNFDGKEYYLQALTLLISETDVTSLVLFFLVVVEALKCLCNLAYNCPKVQTICSGNGTLDGIVQRLRIHPDANLPHPVKYFDVKLLFLMSALSADVRYVLHRTLSRWIKNETIFPKNIHITDLV